MTQKEFKTELSNAKTVKEFFDVCNKYYHTDQAKLGILSKAALMANIDTLIKTTNAKPKF